MFETKLTEYIIKHGSNASLDLLLSQVTMHPVYAEFSRRDVRDKYIKEFSKLVVWHYYIVRDETSRLARTIEVSAPGEYLYGESTLCLDEHVYEFIALMLWLSTGAYSYAELLNFEYAYDEKKADRMAIAVRLNAERIIRLLDTCYDPAELRIAINDALMKAVRLEKENKPPPGIPQDYEEPFISWQKAAAACIGLGHSPVKGAKYRLSGKSEHERERILLAHEKAEFVRCYKKTYLNPPETRQVEEGVREVCDNIEAAYRSDASVAEQLAYRIMCSVRSSEYTKCSRKQLLTMKSFIARRDKVERALASGNGSVPLAVLV